MASEHDVRVPRSDREIRRFEEDAFGFADYAQSLAEGLAQADLPFTLGIFGGRGSGKLSLMRLLEQALVEEKFQRQTFLPIWFDASKYDREDAIWRALLIHTLRPAWGHGVSASARGDEP